MNDFSILFKKFGGINLIKHYLKNRVLFFAIQHLLFYGSSKKSLEILRLCIQFKMYKRLTKKYFYVKNQFLHEYNKESLSQNKANIIWICWFQGIENAPLIVQKCYESVKTFFPYKTIHVITTENFEKYVSIPEYITYKWKNKIISDAHFSDILRIELLIKYGGTWIDSTVLCTGNNIPKSFFDSELFVYQILKPGRDGHSFYTSNWFISAYSNNKILMFVRKLLYEYWKNNNRVVDYFIFHMFFAIVCEWFPEEYEKIPKYCNSIPHVLLLELFTEFSVQRFEEIKSMSSIHKLSYKFDEGQINKQNTFYEFLFK